MLFTLFVLGGFQLWNHEVKTSYRHVCLQYIWTRADLQSSKDFIGSNKTNLSEPLSLSLLLCFAIEVPTVAFARSLQRWVSNGNLWIFLPENLPGFPRKYLYKAKKVISSTVAISCGKFFFQSNCLSNVKRIETRVSHWFWRVYFITSLFWGDFK